MSAVATRRMVAPRGRILVASADSAFRKQLMTNPLYADAFREEAWGGAHALAKLGEMQCDSVLLDRHLPDLDVREVAEMIRKRYPQIDVEFVDSQPVMAAPQDVEIVEVRESGSAWRGTNATARETENGDCAREAESFPGMIGSSRGMRHVYALARMVAPRDTPVLITGETGTGKELVAQGIHTLSRRAKQACVVVNCAAIPEALLETELFGHARGAFTGAVQSRLGRIHMAQGGTLFLDEIGDLPLSMQAKLLRFLQNGEVQRLGSVEVHRVDVRVVCATNAALLEMVEARQFRRDLYYRLAVFPIALPPLRTRGEDLRLLAEHVLAQLSAEVALPVKRISAAALAMLQREAWPGNVRELQHALERAFILTGSGEEIRAEHLRGGNEIAEYQTA